MDIDPVLIVGSGPVGVMVANELLRRGVQCRLIDKAAVPDPTSRAFTVHARTLEMLEHAGLAHRQLRGGAPAAMHQIIMAHGTGLEDRFGLTGQPGWHEETINRISGLSHHYRDATKFPEGLVEMDGPCPGDRAPSFRSAAPSAIYTHADAGER
ncbi:MAG: FAD-dependent monooxygenase [Candidatus Binataceae bacterium]